jgi:hypothetical protein
VSELDFEHLAERVRKGYFIGPDTLLQLIAAAQELKGIKAHRRECPEGKDWTECTHCLLSLYYPTQDALAAVTHELTELKDALEFVKRKSLRYRFFASDPVNYAKLQLGWTPKDTK